MSKKIRRWQAVLLAFAVIIAAAPQNASAKEIKVKNYAGQVKNMAVGSTFQIKTNLSASSLKFTSSKKSVATVSSKGLVTAKKKGKATITIRSGKEQQKLKIMVKKPVGYTISKKAGTYSGEVTTTVKVKKGYTVYYTTSEQFTGKNKIKAKSSKTFVFTTTETLKLYPVKGKKMTTAKLRKTEQKSKLRADYLYAVKEKETKEETYTGVLPGAVNSQSLETTAEPSATSLPNASGTEDTSLPDVSETPNTPSPGAPDISPVEPDDSQYGGDDSMAGYVGTDVAQYDETDEDIEIPGDVVEITLPAEAPESKITEDTYEISKKNKLTLTAPETYLLHTETIEEAVDGLIEVDYKQDENGETLTGTVHIILDGINLTSSKNTEPDSDTGLITIKKSATRAVITVKDGSINTLSDTGDTGIDKDDGVSTTYTGGIVCKKTPLTINGSGTLNIYSKNGNGIKATDALKIRNTRINVTGVENGAAAGHNGITGKTELYIYQADLTIHSDGDGIDSNGNIFFRGGTVIVNGPENGGNGALDYGDNNCICEISGGTLIAAGAVGMDDAPTGGSSQPVVNVRFSTAQNAGTYVVLKDGEGNIVLSAQPTKRFQSIILSCKALMLGETYTVCYGTSLNDLTQYTEVTFTSVNVSVGMSGGFGNIPGGGWNPGGNRPW